MQHQAVPTGPAGSPVTNAGSLLCDAGPPAAMEVNSSSVTLPRTPIQAPVDRWTALDETKKTDWQPSGRKQQQKSCCPDGPR